MHNKVCRSILIVINSNDKVKYEPNYTKDAFVWVRHENTSSGLIFPGYVRKKAYLDKDAVKQIFGVAILD